jgi:hypothetical protein
MKYEAFATAVRRPGLQQWWKWHKKEFSKNKINTRIQKNVMCWKKKKKKKGEKKQANKGPLLTDVLIRRRWRQCACEKESRNINTFV